MTTIEFNAYEIHEVKSYRSDVTGEDVKLVSIKISLGQGHPFPTEKIESSKLAEIKAAFDAYVAKATATGKQLRLSARVKAGRSPNGFDKANLRADVNI